jgi:hypothetical protein
MPSLGAAEDEDDEEDDDDEEDENAADADPAAGAVDGAYSGSIERDSAASDSRTTRGEGGVEKQIIKAGNGEHKRAFRYRQSPSPSACKELCM